jgi:hypothetical protein
MPVRLQARPVVGLVAAVLESYLRLAQLRVVQVTLHLHPHRKAIMAVLDRMLGPHLRHQAVAAAQARWEQTHQMLIRREVAVTAQHHQFLAHL